jgi:hypothetical protein
MLPVKELQFSRAEQRGAHVRPVAVEHGAHDGGALVGRGAQRWAELEDAARRRRLQHQRERDVVLVIVPWEFLARRHHRNGCARNRVG